MAIYQSFDALPDELKQRVLAAGQQRYGRAVSPEQLLSNGALAQQLMTAAGIDIGRSADDVGMRDNLSWIDAQMEPAPSADMPAQRAPNASSTPRRASSGKGDRLDAQAAPLPPARPRDMGASDEQGAPLPPRRPSDLGPSNAAPSVDEGGSSKGTGTSPAGPATDSASTGAPAVASKTPIQDAVMGWIDGLLNDRASASVAVPSPDDTRPRKGNESERVASEKTPAGRAMNDMEEGRDRSVWDENAPVNNTNWRDAVSNVYSNPPPTENVRALGRKMVDSDVPQDAAAKLQQAGIDPSTLSYGQKLRMQTMGIDRWIAEQTDQQQRDKKRADTRRNKEATDKSGR